MKNNILLVYNRIKKDIVNNRTGILAFAGIFLLFFVLLDEVCITQILFGFPCPGCGLTRAGILLLKFRFAEAWQMHPFIYVWLCFAVYICYKRYIRGTKIKGLIPLFVGITLAMFVFYVYRMYRFYPDVAPLTQKSESVYHTVMDVLHKTGIIK